MDSTIPAAPVSVGVEITDRQFVVTTRGNGAPATTLFSRDAAGRSRLESFLAGLQGPARVAIAAGTSVAMALAFDAGSVPQREIVLVAPSVAVQSLDLARYAERSL